MPKSDLMRRLERVIRYYGVGAVNTAFGFGLYSAFVWLGLNLYLAQIVAHVCGTIFNYFTYSRHVFHGHRRKPAAFAGAYVFNYLQGLALLAIAHSFVANPYAAGLLTLIVGTSLNYFVLRGFAFGPPSVVDED
jgi:putative flippase GtrA